MANQGHFGIICHVSPALPNVTACDKQLPSVTSYTVQCIYCKFLFATQLRAIAMHCVAYALMQMDITCQHVGHVLITQGKQCHPCILHVMYVMHDVYAEYFKACVVVASRQPPACSLYAQMVSTADTT